MANRFFTDIDDIVPGKNTQSSEDLQNYLLEHSYRDGMSAPSDEKVLYYEGIPIGSRGNIIAINGKAKSRKSVIASAIMSSAFTSNEAGFLGFTTTLSKDPKVLNFDTEQGLGHWIEGSRRVIVDAGLEERPEGFYSHHTRDCEVDKRIALLEFALDLYHPDICVVDGVTDLVFDLNSQEEATRIGGRLMTWSVKYNCLIVAIIHITKGTGYMTGAVGTYLEKKCQTALKCEKDEKDDAVSWITCQYARDKGFPMFGIRYDDPAGHYVRLDQTEVHQTGKGSNNGPATKSEEFKTQFLNAIFRVHSAFNIRQQFRIAISESATGVGLSKLNSRDVTAWYEYLLSSGDVVVHPEQGYIRGEVISAAKAISPELNFTAPLEDHSSDDLPF
jgi:hypothetical protein